MKALIVFLVVLAATAASHAESFAVDRYSDGVAELLQKKLPELALDRLFEAKRESGTWHYAFYTKIEKTWVEEVRIIVRQKSAHSSEVEVAVYRIEGGLVKTKTNPQPLGDAAWSARIRELITP